jgi:AraC-like DNA-binding protein
MSSSSRSSTKQKSVTETALAAGFNDLSSFVRDFKKAYGVSPSHFIPGRTTASQIAKCKSPD